MKNKVSITVNGVERSAEVEPRMLLVHFLREELHLTGTHVGCDTTQCGACTVRMNEQAVKSCTVFAVQADGANVTTVEGLAGGDGLHPIQEAFREHHGLQCGFCTPGMMMAASQLLDRYPEPTLEQIKHQLDGNICRCTGYHNIIKAVQSAAEKIKARKQAQGAR
ncbi:MAG: (2Fe-2S)-binding protein [Xanthobacteraceae bacterium]|nr:(2Fe-2S)-binding protein [Xanthobacteraceae bacterium]MBX3548895.1 (2Fe-2S)-binding protein [Xanthobacteraceae bacterium]MCW5674526.1 (2Fe-2S)-binding protein [Xanthobacteraceae bacterium]